MHVECSSIGIQLTLRDFWLKWSKSERTLLSRCSQLSTFPLNVYCWGNNYRRKVKCRQQISPNVAKLHTLPANIRGSCHRTFSDFSWVLAHFGWPRRPGDNPRGSSHRNENTNEEVDPPKGRDAHQPTSWCKQTPTRRKHTCT